MKEHREQNEELERQIKDLRREIAKLSAVLAFRKLEMGHPGLEKLVHGMSDAGASVKRKMTRFERVSL